MKIQDRHGNELKEGQVVYWGSTGLLAKIKLLEQGGLSTPDGVTPPRIVLEVGLSIQQSHGSSFTRLTDFIVTTDPSETAHVPRILEMVGNGKDKSVQ